MKIFINRLKLKKGTLKDVEKVKLNPSAKKQFLQMMNDKKFEAYYVKILWKSIAQAYVFYDLEDKYFADGKSTCYVCNVFVHSKFRRMGLCTRLMNTIKESAKKKGFSKIVIGVMEDNIPAITLYRNIGFVNDEGKCDYDAVLRDKNGNRIHRKEYLLLSCDL